MHQSSLTSTVHAVTVRQVDYDHAGDAAALVALLDSYAADPAGGGVPLSEEVKARLVPTLRNHPGAFSVIAWARTPDGLAQAVGLVNCFDGFSTFAARPLVNIHDVTVLGVWRGRGVAQQMMAAVEAMARARGACKLTLEVLQGNGPALRAYERQGFAGYALDSAMGEARFLQKPLN